MAQLTAYHAINMQSVQVWYGALQSYDADSITIAAGALSSTYKGNFTYDRLGNVFGQFKGYVQEYDGQKVFEASGIMANAFKVFNLINDRDAYGALEYCLRYSDRITGSGGKDVLLGFAGGDGILGGKGADLIKGMSGNDVLRGGLGTDKIVGGTGADILDGSIDVSRDYFIFESRYDTGSTADTRDRIVNFDRGEDLIDLRKFNLEFSNDKAVGSVWVKDSGPNVIVHVDTSRDGIPDFSFSVMNVKGLNAADFLL